MFMHTKLVKLKKASKKTTLNILKQIRTFLIYLQFYLSLHAKNTPKTTFPINTEIEKLKNT